MPSRKNGLELTLLMKRKKGRQFYAPAVIAEFSDSIQTRRYMVMTKTPAQLQARHFQRDTFCPCPSVLDLLPRLSPAPPPCPIFCQRSRKLATPWNGCSSPSPSLASAARSGSGSARTSLLLGLAGGGVG